MAGIIRELPMTSQFTDYFKKSTGDGTMRFLSKRLYEQFGSEIIKCSQATEVNPLLHAILIYIENEPIDGKGWKETNVVGQGAGNSDYLGIGQISRLTAGNTLFREFKKKQLQQGEVDIMYDALGTKDANFLYDAIKNAEKRANVKGSPFNGSGSDYLGSVVKAEWLKDNVLFCTLVSQIYFGQCLDKHALVTRVDKAFYAYNRGISKDIPSSLNTDDLLKKIANDNGKGYILKSVGKYTPFWFLKEHFN